MERVVITGIGAVSPIGNTIDEILESLKNKKHGIAGLTRFDVSEYETKIGAELKNFDPLLYISKKDVKRMDRFCQYAMASTMLAMDDSGLVADENVNSERLGVVFGSGIGGLYSTEVEHGKLMEKGPDRVSPFLVPLIISDIAPGNIAIKYNARGINYSLVSACSTGAHCIGEAFRILKMNEADAIIAGSSESPITPLGLAGFISAKTLSTRNDPDRSSTPFDKERDGFVIGEGGATLIMETLTHAKKRGAKIYAEIVGYGATCDAHHITAPVPDGNGIARSMQLAINMAGIKPSDIDYINAHGTSTPPNDVTETIAIKSVFGSDTKVPISSTKSYTGHLLGAAGSFEAILSILAMNHGFIPPTLGYKVPDPECDLDYVTEGIRQADLTYTLSNSLGFGGHNASLVFKKYIGD